MAPFVISRSLRMRLSSITSWLHPERAAVSSSHRGVSSSQSREAVAGLFSHRRGVLMRSPLALSTASRRDFTEVHGGKGDGMDGEAGAMDSRTGEQVVVEGKKIEREEDTDVGDAKNQEEAEHQTEKWFHLTGSCALALHHGDITKWYKDGKTDAIVNAANEMMLGGGGVDGAIHRAAGKELLDACLNVPDVSRGVRCRAGDAVITPGFKLPAAKVIHTVGPIYYKEENPAYVLAKAYKSSVSKAVNAGLKYIAFPAISCGVYGYPYEEAAKVSIQALQESAGQLLEVHFVLFEEGTYSAWLAEAEKNLERWTE